MGEKEELEEQVRGLTRQVEDMSARMAALEGREQPARDEPRRSSRRGFLRLGAAAALGGLGMAASKVLPASAATGSNMIVGQANVGETVTTLKADGATPPNQVLAVEAALYNAGTQTTAGAFAGPLQGLGPNAATAVPVEGVDGWASGDASYGVWGLTDTGTGVVGEANTGISIHARRSGRILQDPQSAAPVYLPNDFEQVRDPAGNLWISQAGGVWRQVAIMQLFPDPRRVYDGFVGSTAPGVYGPVDATTKVASQGGGASGVPVGAKAAWCAVMSYQAGVMTIFPDLTTEPIISNWSCGVSGPLSIFYMFVPLSPAGKFKFHAFFTGNRFFDVWGYLL